MLQLLQAILEGNRRAAETMAWRRNQRALIRMNGFSFVVLAPFDVVVAEIQKAISSRHLVDLKKNGKVYIAFNPNQVIYVANRRE